MKPSVFSDHAYAATLMRNYFGIEGELERLDSYADINYRITAESGRQYVLKFALSETDLATVTMQNDVLNHLSRVDPDLPIPRVVTDKDGLDLIAVSDDEGGEVGMRLLTYLPGKLWHQISDQSSPFLKGIGTFLGRLDRGLANFDHPAAQREFVWDLYKAGDVFEHTRAIADPKRRYMAQYLLTQFDALVKPAWESLPKQVIHNDCNDYNLLMGASADGYQVSGLIDFGDMAKTARVAELAIAVAYAILDKADPLGAASAVVTGYHAVNPLQDCELEVLYHLIRTRLVVSVTMSALRKREDPGNAYLSVTEAPAWNAIEQWFQLDPETATQTFRDACGLSTKEPMGATPCSLIDRRRASLGPSLSLSYQEPLKIVRGRMQYLIDHRGNAFLDGVNNVCHVGHCHPHVVAAATQQMAVLNTNTRYLHDNIVNLAEKLTATFPEPLEVVYFVNSGSEANDLALRLAQNYTGGEDVIVLDGAYHGNLSSLIALSPYKYSGPGGKGPGRRVHQVPLPDAYRGHLGNDSDSLGRAYGETIVQTVAEIRSEKLQVAAFFCESLPGCGGQIVLPKDYLHHAYAAVRGAGGLCIADEVQVGFGRVGRAFWGFELQGVVPDIVTLGKPMGNGHPLAAVVTTQAIAQAFENGMEYFNTFGGNPVSCAVGLAVLETIEREDLRAHAQDVGEFLLSGFRALQKDWPVIGDVRGEGLFIGLELVKDRKSLEPAAEEASALVNQMRAMGVLLSTDGPLHNVIKFKPPLQFSKKNAQYLLDCMDLGLKQLATVRGS